MGNCWFLNAYIVSYCFPVFSLFSMHMIVCARVLVFFSFFLAEGYFLPRSVQLRLNLVLVGFIVMDF